MDLHANSFAELFYKIYGAANAKENALAIARTTMPEAEEVFDEELKRVVGENIRLESLLKEASKVSVDEFFYDGYRKAQAFIVKGAIANRMSNLEFFAHEAKLEEERAKSDAPSELDLLRWLKRYQDDAIEYLHDGNRWKRAYLKRCRKNPIGVLLLLPYIENDHKMVIYFGKRFHVSFTSVDAYTGLHYAYEYLKKEY